MWNSFATPGTVARGDRLSPMNADDRGQTRPGADRHEMAPGGNTSGNTQRGAKAGGHRVGGGPPENPHGMDT